MRYRRMPIEIESPEQLGYERIRINLTESSMPDVPLADLGADLSRLVLLYGDHVGHPGLRELIAADVPGASPDDVLLAAGAATALFIVATSLLDRGDHLVVARPNYGTNIETPRAIGCDIDFLDLTFEQRFAVDPDRVAALMTPRTRLVSLTCPHNPSGQVMREPTLRALVALVEERGCRLLVDETYRDMAIGTPLPVAASLSPLVISVASLSKTYGMPGLRTGWIVCRDGALMETFLAAKEQISLTGSVVDEALAFEAYRQRPQRRARALERTASSLGIVRDWIAGQDMFEWVEPQGGVVAFPRIRPDLEVDVDEFYRILNERYGTFVGPGHWFEQSRRHFRLGYGWPTGDQLREGLANLEAAVAQART